MAKTKRWIVASIAAVLLAGLLFISPVLLFAGSNAVVGIYTLLFERQPTEKQLFGVYEYKADWGKATLRLNSGNQFEEQIEIMNEPTKTIKGSWGYESADSGSAAGVTFRPYIDLQDETRGKQYDYGELNFYKPLVGQTYGEINGDTGARFRKQP